MTYAYARVSTREQNTARQLDAFAKIDGIDAVIEEHGSGKNFEDRKEYQRLRRRLRKGDTLIVMSLDRFGRNYFEILDEWRYLTRDKGVMIKVLDMPVINTTGENGLVGQFISDIVLQLLSFVAQSERERIHERQMQGIAAAHARGVKFGRPNIVIPEDFENVSKKVQDGECSIRSAAEMLGLKRVTYYRHFIANGYKAHPDNARKFRPIHHKGGRPRKVGNVEESVIGDWKSKVLADMSLPPAERYKASKSWTPEMRNYAKIKYLSN